MIWKTTLAFLVAFIRNLEDYSTSKKILRIPVLSTLAIIGFSNLGYAQSCVITENGCPPNDITVACGSEMVNDVYGNYADWTPPTYELDCGTGDGDAFQMSFDLPESGSECWIFNKVQRVGTNNGTLNLWKSDGNATGTAEVTSPAFYINGETSGSMTIFAAPGQSFTTSIYLVNSDGVKSGLMDSFVVNQNTTFYEFTVDPDLFDGTTSYRLKFEFLGGTNNASYVDLITFDANLFGNSCSGDVNFSVTSNYVPNDFFPVGTTEVIYTATCLGCSPAITNTCSFNVIVNPIPATPTITATDADCESATGSITVSNYDGNLTYILVNSEGDTQYAINENGVFTEVVPGAYTVRVENADCNAISASATINASEQTPVTPEITATDANCESSTGSITVSNYDGNLTYILVNSEGDTQYAINENGVFNEVVPGAYTVRVENADCNAISASATINASEQTPVTPEITATDADCDSATGSITVSNYDGNLTYILVNSEGDTQYAINENGVFNEVVPGAYTVRVENADCNAISASATINASEQTPVTPEITATDADCESATGSITVSNYDGNLTYILVNSEGDTQYAINENGVFNEVVPGAYTVRVENADCNAISASATINASEQTPVTPEITATDADCESATGSITVSNYDGNLTYILVNSEGDTQYAINENGVFTEVVPGAYTVRVENADCNAISASATINASEQTPVTPEITAIDADCESATGSITVSNYDGNLTYILVNSEGDTQYAINENGVFTEVVPGAYTVRVENADCNAISASATINASEQTPVTPTITATDANCESDTGSITVSNYDNNLTYNLVGENGDVTATFSAGTFSGVAPGTYSVRVENADCNATSASATIAASEQTPVTPTITASDANCESATGSITVSNYDSNLTYILVNSEGDTQYAINENGVFTEVVPGAYTVRVENADCNAISASATINASEQTPVTPTITATDANCESDTGSITVSNYDNNLTYNLVGENGDVTATFSAGTFSGVAPGTYSVRVENADCNAISASATINASEQTPVTPEITATDADCESATGSITVSNYDGNLTYILVNSEGDTQYAINENGVFNEVVPGAYTVRVENADCNAISASATINASEQTPVTPEITATDANCESATGSITVSNYDGNLTYILVNSEGDTQYAINENGVFNEVVPGAYTVRVENADCNAISASATINASEQTPVTPEITATDADCESATGSITVSNYDGNLTYILVNSEGDTQYAINENGVFTEVVPGAYTVRVENADCNAISASATINASEQTPVTPEITATDADCESATGSITVSNYDGNLTYILVNSEGDTQYAINENGVFNEVVPGAYTVRVENADCNAISASATINASEQTPVTPEITATDADCESATGSITVSNYDGNLTYILVNSEGDTQYAINENGVFNEVVPGAYTVRVENADCNAISASATINASEQTPVTPEITATDANCESATGSITVSNYDGNLTYILVNSEGDTQYAINENGVFNEVVPGAYTVRVENADCNAISASATINASEQTPVTPEITATDADCESATGSITVSNYDGNLTYILVNSEGDTQYAINENGVFTEVVPGAYTVRVENADCNAISASATINASEQTPVTPEITATDADCESATGSITVSNYDGNLTYILVNSEGDTQYAINENGVFNEVVPGAYTVRVENADCNAISASATINASEQTPVTPEITATDADCESATGSITVSNYDGNLTYILVNSEGDTQYAINENGVFTEVVPGAYTVRVENADCNAISASATINASEQTPVTPEITATDADCESATGSITVSNYDGNLTYILVNSEGDTQYAINENGVFNEVVPGAYTVRVENADCNAISASATINASEQTPVTPEITATDADCESATGSITVSNYDGNLTYILVNSEGDTQYAINENGVFNEVVPGAYTVRVENADCNAISASATINASEQTPVTPEITATDADCESATGSITVSNYDGNLTYILVNSEGDTQYAINENGVFTEVVPGAYTVRVENADCNAISASATINASEQTPVTPTITATDANCESDTGSITVSNYDNNLTYNLVGENGDVTATFSAGTFSGVAPGTYSVRVENADCNATSASATIAASEQTPVTPTITASDANCESATGSITVSNYDSNLTYNLVDENGDVTVTFSAGTFSGVAPGSYSVRVENADCNATSASATIAASEQTPVTPTITATDANCESATGSITVSNYNADLTYILVGENEDVTATFSAGIFSGVAPGTYSVRVENADCNATSASATIAASEQTPVTPTITGTDANCESATGSITVSNYNADLTYILVGENGDVTATFSAGTFSGVAPGTYSVRVGEGNCAVSSNQVEINEQVTQDIQLVNNGTVDLCIEDSTFDLFDLFSGDYDETGTWEDTNETGALTGSRIDPSLLEVGNYSFSYVIGGNCPSTTTVAVSINDDCVVLPCGLEDIRNSISKAVTPNADGHNDYFTVNLDTDCGFTYNVKIFNRWGNEIYNNPNYQNNWDGQSNRSFNSTNQLPSGTYYYIIEINGSGFEPIQGYIYLGTK